MQSFLQFRLIIPRFHKENKNKDIAFFYFLFYHKEVEGGDGFA